MQEHEWTALSTLNGLAIPNPTELNERFLYQQLYNRAVEVLGVATVECPLFSHVIELVHQLGGDGGGVALHRESEQPPVAHKSGAAGARQQHVIHRRLRDARRAALIIIFKFALA